MVSLTSVAQDCIYTLNMSDTYGDGWNGATVEVLIDGLSQGSFAAADFGSSEDFDVNESQTIELIYAAGDYEEENSYQWINNSGLAIFSDGPEPNVGAVYTGGVDCTVTTLPGAIPCAAIALDTTACVIADNSGLGDSGFNAGCANYQGSDIWFEVTVPPSGNVIVNTNQTGGLNDTGLAIWESTSCFSISQIDCDDDSGTDYFSFISLFNLNPGETLYVQVWGYGGADGEFEICMVDPGTVTLEASTLPIVDIQTNGQEIPNEPKIDAFMRLMYNGPGNLTSVSDSANIYYGHIGIEIRGQSSANYPQRPYGFETRDSLGENNNVSLLGMPEENDWVFLSNYNDKTFLRNLLAQDLFTSMGHYAPRLTLCEVLVDSLYQGIYLIGEKIKRDIGRVDIATLNPSENSGDDMTGGYIFKSDLANSGNSWTSNYSPIDHPDFEVDFVYHYPKQDDITTQQKDYLASFVDSMETRLYAPNYADQTDGFRSMMDELSFIDYFIVNELSRNNDGFKKSRYYHKDKNSNGGKLHAGPTWDFDWGWKNLNACDIFSQIDGSGWAHQINDCPTDNYSPGWYIRMLQDSTFANNLNCRYTDLRTTVLDTTYLYNYIDSVTTLVNDAQSRHYQKWPTLGFNVGAPEVGPIPDTFQGEIDFLKEWIGIRLTWLDENMPGLCAPLSVSELEANAVQLYPNPSTGHVFLRSADPRTDVHFYDVKGSQIDPTNIEHGRETQRYELAQTGLVFYRILLDGVQIGTGKLIVE